MKLNDSQLECIKFAFTDLHKNYDDNISFVSYRDNEKNIPCFGVVAKNYKWIGQVVNNLVDLYDEYMPEYKDERAMMVENILHYGIGVWNGSIIYYWSEIPPIPDLINL